MQRKISASGLALLLVPLLGLVAIGTVAYSLLEGWTLLDSLYATIITITTVGYGDLTPSTPAGRLFAIVFTLAAIGLAGYAISALAALVIEYESTRIAREMEGRRMKAVEELENHIIVCGATSVGHRSASEFHRQNIPFVILETDEAKLKRGMLWLHEGYVRKRMAHYSDLTRVNLEEEESKSVAELADELGIAYLLEDATDEQQLRRVGVDRARGLVAALDDDLANLAVILSARDMSTRLGNKNMRIVSSANDEGSIHRLYLAGADKVTSPDMMGGYNVASNMLHPAMGDYLEHILFRDEQMTRFGDISCADYPNLIGLTVAELKDRHSQLVLAIRRDGQFMHAPSFDETFRPNDEMIVIGPTMVK